ncbi:unnamed protein product, partial [marine sediment metagenome]
ASHVLSNFYNLTRSEYYRQIDKATRQNDITDFLFYAIQGFRDGLVEVLDLIQENQLLVMWRNYILDIFEKQIAGGKESKTAKRKRDLILKIPHGQALNLNKILGAGMNEETRDYLHEMGTLCATAGAVGLYHVQNITPEAVDYGPKLLVPNHKTYAIDDRELDELLSSYPVLWPNKDAGPEKCFIGCPHLSMQQLYWWTDKIDRALEKESRKQLPVKTTICAAPQVLQKFKADEKAYKRLERAGVKLSVGCPMQLFDKDLSAGEAIVTNSNKLR